MRDIRSIIRRILLLLYAPDERIVLPDGMDDWRFLLVHGEAADSHEYGLDEADPRRPSLPAWSLGPDALVRASYRRGCRVRATKATATIKTARRASQSLVD
jgi:hypothetical protein